MKTEYKNFFIDTSLFIYLLEDYKEYSSQVLEVFNYCILYEVKFVTSIITYMEFTVKPYREKKYIIIDEFKNLLFDLNAELVNINLDIADRAARLRSQYNLKPMDALQISCAIYSNCNKFISNDKRLKAITEVEIVLLDDLCTGNIKL